MQDRIRIGELLAGVGAIGLTLLLIFGQWFGIEVTGRGAVEGVSLSQTAGSDRMGWLLLVLFAASALAGLIFLFRVLTAPTTARVMAQGPVAFAVGSLALIVGLIRLLLFTPDVPWTITAAETLGVLEFDTGLTTAGYLGLLCLALIPIGSWIAIADERDDTPAARAQTLALLADVPVRPAPPHTDAVPESEAGVVADDAIGTDPTSPNTPPPGASPA